MTSKGTKMPTKNNDKTWTLCLNEAKSSQRHILHLASSATLQDLLDRSQLVFGPCQLKFGFPPRLIESHPHTTLEQAGLTNQERILVLPSADTGESMSASATQASSSPRKASKADDGDKNCEESSSQPQRRHKRAAAAAAEASFAQIIRAQDEVLQSEASQCQPSSKRTSTPTSKQVSPSARSHNSRQQRFQAASTIGFRLRDGTAVSPRKKPRVSAQATANVPVDGSLSQEDATAMALLQAAEGGERSNSSVSRLMRRNWRQAVNDAYEQNQAVARLAAIASRVAQFQISGSMSGKGSFASSSISPASLVVTYPRGVQGRGDYTDTVDFLPLPILQSVVAAIHPSNPEALRAENLALLSPRVLWSLIYHSTASASRSTDEDGTLPSSPAITSVESALRRIQPDLDWAFLRRRREQLSEKALENRRQQQEKSAGTQHGESNWEAAARAIESVEQAMADLHTLDRTQRAARFAQAASQRVTWTVVTPTETDEDELRECIGDSLPESETISLLRLLLQLGIHNWRELANVEEEKLASEVHRDVAVVASWIDKAQEETLGEIMVEVCNGNVAGVELLQTIESATPKDLATWRNIVPCLHQTLLERNPNEPIPDQDELHLWCERAQRALEQLEWLNWFATSLQEVEVADRRTT